MKAGSNLNAAGSRQRIVELDVLRGFAIFGILIANMPQYFLPDLLSGNAISIRGDADADVLSWLIVHTLVDNKFLTLFSVLFGISFAILMDKFVARPGGKLNMFRRLCALFGFGLIHGLFFYYADILTGYAVAALLLWPLASRRPRTQTVVGVVLLTVVIGPWLYVISAPESDAAALSQKLNTAKLELSLALADDQSDGHGEAAEFSLPETSAAWDEIRAYRNGPFAESVIERQEHLLNISIYIVAYVLWRSLALFLIGAGIYRSGWLTGRTTADWRRYLAWSLPIGILLNGVVSYAIYQNFVGDGQLSRELAIADELAALVLAFAYASLMFWVVKSGLMVGITSRIASVGRTALSNYVLQSAAMSVLATHYGLSLFGQLSRADMIGLSLLFFVAQTFVSHAWLGRFRYGPLEWIWRCITYWVLMSNQRLGKQQEAS